MKLTLKIHKALIKAGILHNGQKRKCDGLLYIVHPFSVAVILSNYTDDEDIITASLLHDVLEDAKGYSYSDLSSDFGEKVAKIVKEVSEDKETGNNWKDRKEKYLANLKTASFEALMVCCADKIHNLISMMDAYLDQGNSLWEKFNAPKDEKLWFYNEVLGVLKEKLDNPIVQELEKKYSEAKACFGFRILKKPIQFHLWQKENLNRDDFGHENFETVEQMEEDSHYDSSIQKCKRCGQLYLCNWYEEIDWKDGNDQIYTSYIPISENDINEIKDKRPFALSFYFPRLLFDPDDKISWIGR